MLGGLLPTFMVLMVVGQPIPQSDMTEKIPVIVRMALEFSSSTEQSSIALFNQAFSQ